MGVEKFRVIQFFREFSRFDRESLVHGTIRNVRCNISDSHVRCNSDSAIGSVIAVLPNSSASISSSLASVEKIQARKMLGIAKARQKLTGNS
jgi:hypothetical protein